MTELPPTEENSKWKGSGTEALDKRDILKAVKVKNKVVWTNPNLPFNLQKDQSAPIGVFLVPNADKKNQSRPQAKLIDLDIKPGHRRTAELGKIVFSDEQGDIYRDLNLKGVGFTTYNEKGEPAVEPVQPYPSGIMAQYGGEYADEAMGIYKRDLAELDANIAEEWHKVGIRTDRIIAIIELQEIVTGEGDVISVEEAKTRGLIPENNIPVLSVRAFGVGTRVGEYKDIEVDHVSKREHSNVEKKMAAIKDAMNFVEQELKLKAKTNPEGINIREQFGMSHEDFTPRDYVKWFAGTLGRNIGLMHANGWYHKYIKTSYGRPANITLDCRITDRDGAGKLDKLRPMRRRARIHREIEESLKMLKRFNEYVSLLFGENYFSLAPKISAETKSLFEQEYLKVVPSDIAKEYESLSEAGIL